MKHIQLFMAPYQNETNRLEVDGQLVSIKHTEGWTIVKWKEEGFKEIQESRFPYWNISMIRVYKND